MADTRHLHLPPGVEGERVDAALRRMLGVSRTMAAALAQDGHVELDGRRLGKSDRLPGSGVLSVDLPEIAPARPPAAVPNLRIVFEDNDIVVVDKPAGVAAHGSPGWDGATVIGGLAASGHTIATSGPAERQGIVHRLDVGTSGVMAVAKSERAYSALKRAFRQRQVTKVYHAIVQGHPDPFSGTIEAPIGRHPGADFRFAVLDGGKPAVTHYELIEAFRGAALVRVELETGRTHQIRVHFAALGHPLVGDPMYGANPRLAARLGLDRQWLHACQLGFLHPSTGQGVEFAVPYADDLAQALERLRQDGA